MLVEIIRGIPTLEGGHIASNKIDLSIGIISLFILSAVAPIGMGLDVKNIVIEPETTMNGGGPMDSAWPMYCHDAKRTGLSPYGKPGDIGELKWKTRTGGMVTSSPAIDKDGTVYIGGLDWKLYALNSDGSQKWTYKTGGAIESSPAIGEDGTIYVGSTDCHLYAINPNGTKKWRLGMDSSYSSPLIDNDGIIYIGSVDGRNIWAVYPNGTKKWDYYTGGRVYCEPSLDDNGILYCGSNNGYMYALFSNNGTLKWKYKTGEQIGSEPTIADDGTIYFGSNDGYMYALNPNGTRKWRFYAGKGPICSSPAIAEDGSIYFGYLGGYIFGLFPDGTEKWRYPTCSPNGEISASPAIDKNGIIYVGDWDGFFYALNPDGTARWKIFTDPGSILPSAAIDENGIIYFGVDFPEFKAYVYAIEPTGENKPPGKPMVNGPSEGIRLIPYIFSAQATDPDGDDVSYFFDWGDGYDSGWHDFVPSNTLLMDHHYWDVYGHYDVKVRAQDIYGADSEWTTLSFTVPRNHATSGSVWQGFLDMFPILERILSLF